MAKTVMVVDDDSDFLELLDALLAPEGYDVVSCIDPTVAFEKIKALHPDVVVVDLLMPGRTGWQIIEQTKNDPIVSTTHIIVCTAAVADAMEHLAKLRQWGCAILLKPFELDDLLAMVSGAADCRPAT